MEDAARRWDVEPCAPGTTERVAVLRIVLAVLALAVFAKAAILGWRDPLLFAALDNDTKAAIDKKTIGSIQEVAYRNGAMVRVSGNNIILSPPLVLTSEDVQTMLSALDAGFEAAQ